MIIKFGNKVIHSFRTGRTGALSVFKYYARWKESLQPGNNAVKDELPWITFPAIDFLNNYLKKEMCVFEYGGGGSTLFFLSKAGQVYTVEHDQTWFEKINSIVEEKYPAKWIGKFILPEKRTGSLADVADPYCYSSDDQNFSGYTFKEYASYIDHFSNGKFDVVLIDGRARPSCIVHAVSKIKQGGILVLDNADRAYYLEKTKEALQSFTLVLDQFAPAPYTDFFTQTNIWVKK